MTMVFQWENYTFRKYYTVLNSRFLGTHKQDTSRDKLPEPFALTMRRRKVRRILPPSGQLSGPGGTAEDKAFLWLKPSGGVPPLSHCDTRGPALESRHVAGSKNSEVNTASA